MDVRPHLLVVATNYVETTGGVEGHLQRLLPFLARHDPGQAEGNHAAEISCVFGAHNRILINDGKGHLGMIHDRADLVAIFRGMKVNLFIEINIAEWHSIRVPVVTQTGQDTMGATAHDRRGVLSRQRLLPSSHLSEHRKSVE